MRDGPVLHLVRGKNHSPVAATLVILAIATLGALALLAGAPSARHHARLTAVAAATSASPFAPADSGTPVRSRYSGQTRPVRLKGPH